MEKKRPERGRWFALAVLAACLVRPLSAAPAIEPVKGPVLLTVSGALNQKNDGESASFDLALLEMLPRTTFSTKTPWYSTPRKFTGVLFRDLLEAIGSQATSVRAIALNDYRVDIPVDELVKNGAMIAWLLDDQTMPVREKGPLVIMFPFSERAELRTAVHYSRAVWQLRKLELR